MASKDSSLSFVSGQRLSNPTPGDEVVITGIAGRYPESDNIYELQENLFNKVDLVNDDSKRWFVNDTETPKRIGKIKQLNKFDAAFFGIKDEEADFMDPMARILLETAYEAIVDAGISHRELRGSRTGVFIGTSISESEEKCIYQNDRNGFGIKGCSRAMLANRISNWLEISGASFSMDTACSSSAYAFDQAFKSIRDGHCEAALVGGTNLCLNPNISLQTFRFGVLSAGGRCRAFDAGGDGYARSESVSIILLQKMAHAKRVYAKVVYTKINCDGFKEEGVTFPSARVQEQLYKDFYEECGVLPKNVAYVEAHGTGTRAGDGVEANALDSFFIPGRTGPLLVGSIKSNIGHTEPAAGATSIAKCCIIFETGIIPPNLHFDSPLPGPVEEGRLKIVCEKTQFDGDFIGINSFGFGGSNCHILLERNQKEKSMQSECMQQTQSLVLVSGRTKTSIDFMLDNLKNHKFDPEYYRLINDAHQERVPGHIYRGYAVIAQEEFETPLCISRNVSYLQETRKSIWFVFTGFSSTNIATGKQLLTIPIFSTTIKRCSEIVSPKGLDVLQILDRNSVNILELMIGNICIYIGLVNTLKIIGITPDYVIASDAIGELACAYTDKCLTMEQTILATYYIGTTLLDAKYEKDAESVVRTIINNGLTTLIPEPVVRSDKWISLSVLQPTSTNCRRFCSAEYFTKSVSSYVCIEKMFKCIASNAIALQVGLSETELNTFSKSIKNITYVTFLGNKHMNRNDSIAISLGKLYLAGFDLNIAKLYPAFEFPVSRGTPMISPLIKWDHNKDRAIYESCDTIEHGNRTVTISLANKELSYLSGHVIDGRNLFPATGYLQLVWESVGMIRGILYKNLSIVFEEVQFLRATNIPKDGTVQFLVTVHKATGNFEITESGVTVVSGRVFVPDDITNEQANLDYPILSSQDCGFPLTADDIYKELRIRGYNYSGSFRGLLSCDTKGIAGEALWQDNWVSFLDNMLQMLLIKVDTRKLYVPTAIQKLSINCNAHAQNILEKNDKKFVKVYQYGTLDILKSAGVEVRGMAVSPITRRRLQENLVLEVHRFIPYFCKSEMTLQDILRININLALENSLLYKVKIVELVKDSSAKPIAKELVLCLSNVALVKSEILIVRNSDVILSDLGEGVTLEQGHLADQSNCFMVTGTKLLQEAELMHNAVNALSTNGFLLLREKPSIDPSIPKSLQLLTSYITNTERIMLLKKISPPRVITTLRIDDRDLTFGWLDLIKDLIKTDKRVVLYAESQVTNGILGFVNCIRKEPGGEQVKCVFVLDKGAPPFRPEDDFYKKQLDLNLAVNIYKDGQWGSYTYLVIDQTELVLTEHAFVDITTRGDLSSLRWTEGPLTISNASPVERTLVQPYFGSLNFRDVMKATNKLTHGGFGEARNKHICDIGFEYSGVTTSGRRVMGFGLPPMLSTLILADDYSMWDVPDDWTLQDAATVPIVYGTVLYALVIVGGICQGMDVLIHAGSGAIGQAAITIALHYKCTVYTTVGTKEKKDFIKKHFPQIKDRHIGNSRDTSFEQLVLMETNGRGVNMVLNSLSEDKLFASVRCVAQNGHFLEIGKFDLMNNNKIRVGNFQRGISFYGISLNFFATKEKKKKLHELLATGIKTGLVRPLPFTTFKADQVEEAFRYMAASKHIGKVLIQLRNEDHDGRSQSTYPLIYSTPRFYCQPNMTYVLCGGLGGFGLELADWLVLRGAMKLVITSRHGITTGYQAFRVQTWRGYGCTVKVSNEDCTTLNGCKCLLQDAELIGPVVAIFNLAAVLRDALLENQTTKYFKEVFLSKVDVTRNLDIASRKYCPSVQHFVVFSSISCGRGNAGQTNYGMANSVMERICELRVQEGLPGLAIQWGAIGDVGLVATMQGDANIDIGGTSPQRICSCLEVMDIFLRTSAPVVSSMVLAEKSFKSKTEITAVEYAAKLIGVRDVRLVSAQTTLPELGMDSMMVIELKQGLERDYEIFLTPTEIRQLTFTGLELLSESRTQVNDVNFNVETKAKENKSFQIYLHRFCSEAEAAQPIVQLSSFETSNATPTVFLIPGIEGVSISVKPLASKLRCQIFCLQLAYQSSYKSVEDISKELLPHVKNRINNCTTFYFIGYSFGCLVAFELARMLESEGQRGKLCFIDGAPGLYKQLVQNESEDQELQINILTYLTPVVSSEIKPLLRKEPTWSQKMDVILKKFSTDFQFSKELMILIFNSTYFRVLAAKNYDPDHKTLLKSHMTLVRPTGTKYMVNTEQDYSLSTWTEIPVPVKFIEANHETVIDTEQCATIINKLFVNDSN